MILYSLSLKLDEEDCSHSNRHRSNKPKKHHTLKTESAVVDHVSKPENPEVLSNEMGPETKETEEEVNLGEEQNIEENGKYVNERLQEEQIQESHDVEEKSLVNGKEDDNLHQMSMSVVSESTTKRTYRDTPLDICSSDENNEESANELNYDIDWAEVDAGKAAGLPGEWEPVSSSPTADELLHSAIGSDLCDALKIKAAAYANHSWQSYWCTYGPLYLAKCWEEQYPDIPLKHVEVISGLEFLCGRLQNEMTLNEKEGEFQNVSSSETMVTEKEQFQNASSSETMVTKEGEFQNVSSSETMVTKEGEFLNVSSSETMVTEEEQFQNVSSSETMVTEKEQFQNVSSSETMVTKEGEFQNVSSSETMVTEEEQFQNVSSSETMVTEEEQFQNVSSSENMVNDITQSTNEASSKLHIKNKPESHTKNQAGTDTEKQVPTESQIVSHQDEVSEMQRSQEHFEQAKEPSSSSTKDSSSLADEEILALWNSFYNDIYWYTYTLYQYQQEGRLEDEGSVKKDDEEKEDEDEEEEEDERDEDKVDWVQAILQRTMNSDEVCSFNVS